MKKLLKETLNLVSGGGIKYIYIVYNDKTGECFPKAFIDLDKAERLDKIVNPPDNKTETDSSLEFKQNCGIKEL